MLKLLFFLLSKYRREGKPPEMGLGRGGAGIFPDLHLHLSETVVDGSCYPQIEKPK